jgi:hypothetical protein
MNRISSKKVVEQEHERMVEWRGKLLQSREMLADPG